jgi:hypothetical protein
MRMTGCKEIHMVNKMKLGQLLGQRRVAQKRIEICPTQRCIYPAKECVPGMTMRTYTRPRAKKAFEVTFYSGSISISTSPSSSSA